VHGAGGDHGHWPPELAELSSHEVYFLDLPGHGRSAGPPRDHVEAYADWLADWVAACGLQRVTLAGHSLGGAIVQTLALRHPPWLDAIILVGSGARLKVQPAIVDQLRTDPAATVELICQSLFGSAPLPEQVETERRRYRALDWRVLQADFTACSRFDVMERLGEITAPTLVVTGADDLLTPVKYSHYLAEHIPGARLVVVPAAGHLLPLERTAEFVTALQEFLDDVP